MNQLTVSNNQLATTNASTANSIALWAKTSTTPDSERYGDMVRDKSNAVSEFFAFSDITPNQVTPQDVDAWVEDMRERQLASATIYARTSMLSSYYTWLRETWPALPNPVDMARPKPPKPYEHSQALADEELVALFAAVREEAEGSLTAKRDLAMLTFFVLTGHRREEVTRLVWSDLKKNGTLQVRFLVKGGDYNSEHVSLLCWDALVDYLDAAGRLDSMEPDTPLWVAHDRAGHATTTGRRLTSRAFAGNLKRYATRAGIDSIHVHQLRHTVARMVGEDTGDMTAVQKVLGHKNLQTTRHYLARVSVKRDAHSAAIAARLGL